MRLTADRARPRSGILGHAARFLANTAEAAKAAGRSFKLYAPDLDNFSPRRLSLAGELRSAASRGELTVEYQPIADIAGRRITAFEALVRWDHPKHGRLEPDQFIPLAEDTGAIGIVTASVIAQALQQCRAWKDQGHDLAISVNLSACNLIQPNLADQIRTMLTFANLEPDQLILEITESSIMADPGRMIATLTELADLGVHLAIDDFGTGYSSLAYLQRLPVHAVKIDKSFVRGLGEGDNDTVIVRSIIDLGLNLGLAVVAEGVEDRRAFELLRSFGCSNAQGFYIGRPMPASEVTVHLASGRFCSLPGARLLDLATEPGRAADIARRRPCAGHTLSPAAVPASARR